ncbi:MAG: lysylphosphatidylglycerol synthase transmembrane domain-containing protein [Ginsengibacter sp.]
MNKSLRTIFQYIFFLGLGIFFAWLSLKNLNSDKIAQIKIAIHNAKHWLIIPVFGILILSHFVRALRWRLLMEPLGYNPSKINTFFAVMIGYLTNQAVPRLGEVLKCTILARYEKIPADKLIGTIILERIIDAITLLIIFGITLAIQPHLYQQLLGAFFSAPENQEEKKTATWIIILIILTLIFIVIGFWMYLKKKKVSDFISLIKKTIQRIVLGITSVRHLKKRSYFIFLTFTLWSLYLSGGYLGFMALQETSHYGIKEAFTVLSAGSIGMIASPGGIGAYAYLLQQTMQLYGLNEAIALAFGWILWLAQTAVILIAGLISFVALPFYNKKKIQSERS